MILRIILASASPRRKELMELVTDNFVIIPSNAEENVPDNISADNTAGYLARLKALAVLKENPDAVVIGCDTVVVLGDEIMGKPADRNDAIRMITALSGKKHKVITGVCIASYNKNGDIREKLFSQVSEVEFYPLDEKEIEEYVDSGEPFDKAGAYGIQGKGGVFVKEIRGDFYNIVGLPAARLKRELLSYTVRGGNAHC